VVGILAPTGTVLDRLVLTDIETVRYVHIAQAKAEKEERGSSDEDVGTLAPGAATAVVAAYRVPTAAILMQREIDSKEGLSAASPSLEIARLLGYARPLTVAAEGFGLLLVAIAAVGAAVGLLTALAGRARDLALLRALGAGRASLAMVVFSEAAMIAAGGLAFGALVSYGLLSLAGDVLSEQTGLLLRPQLGIVVIVAVISGTILVTIVAAALPALRAMHTDIEELLQS
jgi:putative ABC transport system permease protein